MSGDGTELSADRCWALLRAHEFGRLAFHLDGRVHIAPVNYAVHGRRLVFRTAPGAKLRGIGADADVAFEIDEYGEERARSVVARGRAVELEGREAAVADQLPLRPWVPSDKPHVVAVEVDAVTGCDFVLARPWTRMRPRA